ncbi:GNAT family N-acetyltransferase [Deinococcus cavernae]|uniref:GNAT family N-acetyltransferase n=1 Tax=Deinococcus cavernae TaxID=2320857 RepID=A0A418V894_9DEIO|nr:GNAT family N-acetyltransferase [Deinococcus cavernae]RJF72296.1 GNAT family N-acetyltransferase [Deinococcus cavernae]
MIEVRILTAQDVESYRVVRHTVLNSDPVAFVTTAAEFAARDTEGIAAQISPTEEHVTFGAFLGGQLVGILSLARETRPSIRHRASIYGVGVLAEARGQGAGDALLQAAIKHAETWEGLTSLHLAVVETQHTARRLYERHGFTVWGTQPDAVQHSGQTYSEYWLWRDMKPGQ